MLSSPCVLRLFLAWALTLTSCSNRATQSSDSLATDTSSLISVSPPVITTPHAIMFGDLPSPCGKSPQGMTARIAVAENGKSPNAIRVATASDKGAVLAPGLNAELFDAAVAFAGWCNAQGGIVGLPLKILDADAKLFEVPAVMENICENSFAMVGGGLAFDDAEFPRFHECSMIDIAGFVVTTTKAESDNMVSPSPNPSHVKDAGWFKWAVTTHPVDMLAFATVYGDLLTSQIVEQQYVDAAQLIGGTKVVSRITYNPAGEASWTPIAQKLKTSGVKAMSFVGVPELLALLLKAMDEINYRPNLIMVDAGFYANILLSRAGSSLQNVVIRSGFPLFEEATSHPAVLDYLNMMKMYRPEGKVAALGMQATSAFLLFASAAKDCIIANDGELRRSCVMERAKKITPWTAGGLHPPQNPGSNRPSPCYQMIQVIDGAFTRLYPALNPTVADKALIPTAEITEDGWACDPSTVVTLEGDYGDVNLGKLP